MKELLEIVHARHARPDLPFALATVVRVDGSSYRKPGARMLISVNGRVQGSISGGCLERDVLSQGMALIPDGAPAIVAYDTTDNDDMAFGTSLGCNGRIEILLQTLAPRAPWFLAAAAQSVVASRTPRVLATCYGASAHLAPLLGASFWLDPAFKTPISPIHPSPLGLSGEIAAALDLATPALAGPAAEVLAGQRSQGRRYPVEAGHLDLLLERIVPPRRLVLCGAGHDVPPLVTLASEMGYHVTVIDRRPDFADPARFPGAVAVLQGRPHQLRQLGILDRHTAVVAMNHHYETDSETIGELLGEPLAYLGVLGPRKRTVKILRELQDSGLLITPADLARLHSPVGLDLGSETPEQIALCILAEVQAVMSGRSAVQLRDPSALLREVLAPAPTHRPVAVA
jgi:xanthine dehydrogenase accessory factor